MSTFVEKVPPPPDLTNFIVRSSDQFSNGGCFGDVYKCLYNCGADAPKEVAVKAFRCRSEDPSRSNRMIRRELGIWSRLDHKNIVPFLGIAYGFGVQGAMSLVSLWMVNDTLRVFLEKYGQELNVACRLQLLLDIANGLEYLHSFPIVHGDLSCKNVLLDANYTARLADFGYASLLGDIPEAFAYLEMSTNRPGAMQWAEPEKILTEPGFKLTTKSDIYSFGRISLQEGIVWKETMVGAKPATPLGFHPAMLVTGAGTAFSNGSYYMHSAVFGLLSTDLNETNDPSVALTLIPGGNMLNKSGETVSLALVAQVPGAGTIVGANGGLGWHSDASVDPLFREACGETGNYSYSPLYASKRRQEKLLKQLPNKLIINNHLKNVLQRKYIDIINRESSGWINWNASISDVLKVGDYGDVDKGTGKFDVSGNINSSDFQDEIDKLGLRLCPADHPPQEKDEADLILSSKGAKQVDLRSEAGIASIANAPLKGQWKFEQGKQDALLIMHRPRLLSLGEVNLDTLYKVPRLKDKWLVTSVYICPAFFMYLSNKSGETVSLALVPQVPAAGVTEGANGGLGWRSDAPTDSLIWGAYDEMGNYSYTPLFSLKRSREGTLKRLFRRVDETAAVGSLNDDGDIDSLAPTAGPDESEFFKNMHAVILCIYHTYDHPRSWFGYHEE